MLIKNGKVALPGENTFRNLDIQTKDGKITAIARNLDEKDDQIIDARNLLIFPGAIDAHVHFNDPGYEEKEDFFTGSSFAASGGVTTVIDMPCTSIPPVIDINSLSSKMEKIKNKSVVDYALFGGVSSDSYDNLQNLSQDFINTIAGLKCYFTSSMDSFKAISHYQFREILRFARRNSLPVLLHAEDNCFVESATKILRKKGHQLMHYYNSRPEIAEVLAVKDALLLNSDIKAKLHFVHISCGESIEYIKKYGCSCETAPHYLQFDIDDFMKKGSALKVAPPVKLPQNKFALWKAIAAGKVNFIASDHAPAPEKNKKTNSIWTDYSGIPGTGTLFPYMLSEGLFKGKIGLRKLTEITAYNPSQFYKLDNRKGSVEIGKDADLIIVDPERNYKIKGSDFLSKGKITPFEDMIFNGLITKTIVRGEIVFTEENGITAKPGYGKFLKPGYLN